MCLTLSITFNWDCYWTKDLCKNLSWFWTWSKPASKRLQCNNILLKLWWSKSWEWYQLSGHALTSLSEEWAPAPRQQSSLRFDDAEPSWAVQRKPTSAVRAVLPLPCAGLQPSTSAGKPRQPLPEAAPEIPAPFKYNCYLLIYHSLYLDFWLQELSTTGTYVFLKVTVQHDTNTCLNVLLVLSWPISDWQQ